MGGLPNMDKHITYKTPSKAKMKELNNQVGGNIVYKKITALALTGALTFGALGTLGTETFNFGTEKTAAATIQGTTLDVQKIYGREQGAYIGGSVAVYGKKAGTVVFKLSPSPGSKWSVEKNLNLKSKMILGDTDFNPVAKTELKEVNGKQYLLAYVYVADTVKSAGVDLITNDGEYGYEPIVYEANYVEGQDLTKGGSSPNVPSVQPKKVYWEGAELKKGQIGKIDVTKPINLWKRDGNKLTYVRVLKPGESYRVYSYDSKFGGQYGLGGGYYITNMKSYITYKTPSKAKLAELNN